MPASVDDALLDEVITATRALIAMLTRSLGPLAEDLSAAQYRALVVLASHGPQRLVDLANRLHVTASTAGRMCDRLTRKGLIQRRRTPADRRTVRISLSHAGRDALDAATARRRQALADILDTLTPDQRNATVTALKALTATIGEIPDHDWPVGAQNLLPTRASRLHVAAARRVA